MEKVQGFLGRGLSRRDAIKRLGASMLIGGGVAGGSGPAANAADQKGPINFLTWGGAFGKGIRTAFSDPFTAKTGIPIRDITPFNLGKFRTAMQHGNPEGYDLVWFDDEVEPTLLGPEGMVEALNYDWIPNAAGAVAGARQKFGAAPYVTIYAMSYNANACQGKIPAGWKDFWDVTGIPGPRSLGTWVCGVLEAALMADGVPPSQLYPLDEARAFKMLDQIKPHIRVFHDTQANAAVQQMLEQGEVAMILTWATDTVTAKLAGKPVGVVYDQGFYFSPLVGIAKGSKYLKECHQYLNLFFDPAAEQAFIEAWPTTPANPAVLPLLTEKQKSMVATGHLDQMVHFSVEYYAKNRDRLQQKYDSWRIT